MGEGEGGGGQDEDPLGPPPLHPLPPKGGESFGRICLNNYGLLSNAPPFLTGFTSFLLYISLPDKA